MIPNKHCVRSVVDKAEKALPRRTQILGFWYARLHEQECHPANKYHVTFAYVRACLR